MNHTDPLPDGDTVVPAGRRRFADILADRPARPALDRTPPRRGRLLPALARWQDPIDPAHNRHS